MKYVLILIVVAVMVRIDFVLEQIGSLNRKIRESVDRPAPQAVVVESETIAVPIAEDKALKQNPRGGFFLLVDQFLAAPNQDNKTRVIAYLKQNPKLFSEKLEKDLETKVYGLRNLFLQGNTEIYYLIQDLMGVLGGENIEMLKRFLSLGLDTNLTTFLKNYPKLKDTNCSIVIYIADPVSEDDKLNLYYERDGAFTEYLTQDKLELADRGFAIRCQQILKAQIEKMLRPIAPAPSGPSVPGLTP